MSGSYFNNKPPTPKPTYYRSKAFSDCSSPFRYYFQNHLDEGLLAVEKLLRTYPRSPRATYAKAKVLDLKSEKHQSNQFLEQAIQFYNEVRYAFAHKPQMVMQAFSN